MRRRLIFLHIPKAAGTTVDVVLRREYPHEEVIAFNSLDKGLSVFEDIPRQVRASARLVKGHLHFGVHRYLEGRWDYVTILRDPISRVVSLYRYVKTDRHHPLHEAVVQANMGLEEFVESGIDRYQTNNGQTRQISGVEESTALDEQMLTSAIENLRKHFVVVGIQERLDESLLLLKRKCTRRIPLYVSKKVSRGRPPALSARELRVLEENNQLDMALYEYAAGRLAAELDEQRPFTAELATIRTLNKAISLWSSVPKVHKALIPRRQTRD